MIEAIAVLMLLAWTVFWPLYVLYDHERRCHDPWQDKKSEDDKGAAR